MKRLILILLFVLLFPFMGQATEEKPAIGVEDPYPQVGKPVQVLVSHASHPLETFTVKVTYRPNSTVSKEQDLGRPNDNGILEWTPQDAGITVIEATANKLDDSKIVIKKQVSVRYGSFPTAGIIMFALAACTLFGGLLITAAKMGRPGAA